MGAPPSRAGRANGDDPAGEGADGPARSEEKLAEDRRRQREAVKILATLNLGSELEQIAMRGACYDFPGWVEQTQTKGGKSKTVYIERRGDAGRKAREYLSVAKTAQEVAGRLLALVAMARYADEGAVARSAQFCPVLLPPARPHGAALRGGDRRPDRRAGRRAATGSPQATKRAERAGQREREVERDALREAIPERIARGSELDGRRALPAARGDRASLRPLHGAGARAQRAGRRARPSSERTGRRRDDWLGRRGGSAAVAGSSAGWGRPRKVVPGRRHPCSGRGLRVSVLLRAEDRHARPRHEGSHPTMNNPLITLLAALAVGGGTAAAVLESVPILTDALTGAGVGALVGGIVAYRRERVARRRRREPSIEPRWLVTRWTWAGTAIGVLIHLGAAVL